MEVVVLVLQLVLLVMEEVAINVFLVLLLLSCSMDSVSVFVLILTMPLEGTVSHVRLTALLAPIIQPVLLVCQDLSMTRTPFLVFQTVQLSTQLL